MNWKIIKLALLIASFCVSVGYAQDSLNVYKVGQLYDYEYSDWTCPDVKLSESYAYLAATGDGLRIFDISNPGEPLEVGYCDGFGGYGPYGLAVSGSLVYATACWDGLFIVDVANPAQPVIVGHCPVPGHSENVTVSGSYAYVAALDSDLRIVDVSNPTAPVEVGHCDLPGGVYDVFVSGNLAYLTNSGLCIVDVSNPTAPVVLGRCALPESTHGLTVVGSYAYVAVGYSGLHIVDISNPLAPTPTGAYITGDQNWDVMVSGQYAYMAYGTPGLLILDVSNPSAPAFAARCETHGQALGLAMSGDFCYLAEYSDGLKVINVADPTAPVKWGWYYPPAIYDVAITGAFGYVAAGSTGLRVVDLSNPIAPVEIGHHRTWGFATSVTVAGSYSYVAAWYDGLRIIDISDPTTPFEVGYFTIPEQWLSAVAISGQYAYLVNVFPSLTPPRGYLHILDVSNPAAPSLIGQVPFSDPACDVVVSGSYAYIADCEGLCIMDVSNPAAPSLVGTCPAHETAVAVALSGSYAFVADAWVGLQVVDVSNPAQPFEVWLSITGGCSGVTVDGSLLYTSDPLPYSEQPHLRIYDISNPAAPNLLGWYSPTGGQAAVSGDCIYEAEGTALGVYQYSPPTLSIVLTPVSPPIYLPASGGMFQYNATIGNDSTTAVNLSAWIRIKLPNGSWLPNPVLGPLPVSLPGGASITRLRSQSVPANAPQGTYTYCGYLGIYPASVLDSCYFTFYKSQYAGTDQDFGNDWTCSGESFPAENETALVQPEAFRFSSISPNPFNATTVVSFQIPDTRQVSLRVYDTAGRLVSTLVEVWREVGVHEVTFDGTHLPSGIYFAKLTAGEFSQVQKLVLLK